LLLKHFTNASGKSSRLKTVVVHDGSAVSFDERANMKNQDEPAAIGIKRRGHSDP
jgi:hypothetical protein